MNIKIETLFDLSTLSLKDGDYTLELVDGTSIDIELYNLGNMEYTSSPTLGSNKKDGPMLVLKYGELVIGSGVSFTPRVRRKGMCIFAETIINNGGITMTARGAAANGDNIYLYKNDNGTYEIIPAVGASGGYISLPDYRNRVYAGQKGYNGINRQTGGGGSGAGGRGSISISHRAYPGRGGKGTSYSGGSGGGAAWAHKTDVYGGNGSNFGRSGGDGTSPTYNYYSNGVGGGAGNPGGQRAIGGERVNLPENGRDGTGGLLIIYANNIINNNIISSDGSLGGYGGSGCGGSSGGGSINIFYGSKGKFVQGYIRADGGSGRSPSGAAGGNGSVTFTRAVFNTRKYFFNINNEIKYLDKNNNFITLDNTIDNITLNDFYKYGMNNIEYNVESSNTNKLSLYICSLNEKLNYITLLKNSIIENIEYIDLPRNKPIYKMEITDYEDENIIKYIFCINDEWYYYSNSKWVKIDKLNIDKPLGNSSAEINSFKDQIWLDFNNIYKKNNLNDKKLKIGCIIINNTIRTSPIISNIEIWSFDSIISSDISSNNYNVSNYYNKYELLWNDSNKNKIQIQYE